MILFPIFLETGISWILSYLHGKCTLECYSAISYASPKRRHLLFAMMKTFDVIFVFPFTERIGKTLRHSRTTGASSSGRRESPRYNNKGKIAMQIMHMDVLSYLEANV